MAETPVVNTRPTPSVLRKYGIHVGLLFLTFLTTTLAGVQWLNRDPAELVFFPSGLIYSVLLLLVLGSHEMGHYLAARHHKVEASLPYFIPFLSTWGLVPFGTLGAVIRLRSTVPSRKALFDIGSAGPIAGFLVSVIILIIGFRTLPPIQYLYSIHPEYESMASIPVTGLTFGKTLLYSLLSNVAPAGAFVPPMNEIYHYPFLCVGWFGLLVTAMNLIPIAQLDGGHISFAMFGVAYHRIAQIALIALVLLGTLGFLPVFGIRFEFGWSGWLLWAILLVVFMRGAGMKRAPVEDDTPLDRIRNFVGWACFAILALAFSLTPFTIELR